MVLHVKMVFDGGFAGSGDDNNVLNSGMQRLFHTLLNEGFVDQRQHLLGLRLGGRQETGTQTRRREYGFADFGVHYIYSLLRWCGNSNWRGAA